MLRRALETFGVEVRVRLPVTERAVVRVERRVERVEVERAICFPFLPTAGRVDLRTIPQLLADFQHFCYLSLASDHRLQGVPYLRFAYAKNYTST